jgi:hypothetical protein
MPITPKSLLILIMIITTTATQSTQPNGEMGEGRSRLSIIALITHTSPVRRRSEADVDSAEGPDTEPGVCVSVSLILSCCECLGVRAGLDT